MDAEPLPCETDRLPVTVVVPTVGRETLRGCLGSLAACRPGADEVVIVVQGDAVAVRDEVDRCGLAGARVVCDPGRGASASTNRGLQSARYEVVLVTHDDCTVDASWVRTGWELARRHPGTIITGRVLPRGDPARVPSCKTDPSPMDFSGTLRIGALYPNNMVLPRSEVLAIGGFDERFRPEEAAEDCDFCYRWLRAGSPLRYEPAFVVRHDDWRTEEELERLYVRYARGSGAVYGKHLRRGDLRIARFLARDLRGAWHGLLDGRRGRPRWSDSRQSILRGLPGGLLFGLRHLGGGSPDRAHGDQ